MFYIVSDTIKALKYDKDMVLRNTCWVYLLNFLFIGSFYGQSSSELSFNKDIVVGAERLEEYVEWLKNKNVAIVANQTTILPTYKVHLVDTLMALGVNVVKVFSPEHGFRGSADAGEKVKSGRDIKTGLEVISLYGKHKKPTKLDLKNVDVVIFDLQDVGARFYTYISTMHYVMEACVENNKTLIILDRPNPNGFYVDGPVLEENKKSFVGMHPIPVVHGLTVGELANMIVGEKWIVSDSSFDMRVITSLHYTHKDFYELPVPPSPNLPNMAAIYLYPSLCFFEGTTISVGRGTEYPFQVFGSPEVKEGTFSFKPTSKTGAKQPLYENQLCVGYSVKEFGEEHIREIKGIYWYWLCNMYESSVNQESFFLSNHFIDLLAGTDKVRKAIQEGTPAQKLTSMWEEDLTTYKKLRKNYLLYDDFE